MFSNASSKEDLLYLITYFLKYKYISFKYKGRYLVHEAYSTSLPIEAGDSSTPTKNIDRNLIR